MITNDKILLSELFFKHNINDIAYKVRDIKHNTVFFAIHGLTNNGNDFINKALKKNVSLIFTDDKSQTHISHKIFFVQNIRDILITSLEILYPKPNQTLIAVTGTNGKTSITLYVGQMLDYLKIPYICIGTLGICSNISLPSELVNLHDGNTVPNQINFRKILHESYKLGIKNVIFEISSHAIDQHRIGNILVDVVGFSSFSQDHLDYHKTIEAYFDTKLSFLQNNVKENVEVVINNDNIYGQKVVTFCKREKIKFSTVGNNADIKILKILPKENFTQQIEFQFNKKIYTIEIKILGNFQAHNILIASQLLQKIVKIDFDNLYPVFKLLKTIDSRLENITNNNRDLISNVLGYHIFIDYAHTPEALELTLMTLKQFIVNQGRLIVIFGCGGEKDISKRVIMGKISSQIADMVVITDDNPRGENPATIRRDIIKGITNKLYKEFDSRKRAIEETITDLKQDDILLIAGKGNENYQIIKNKKIAFNDKKFAIEVLHKSSKNYDKVYPFAPNYTQKILYS